VTTSIATDCVHHQNDLLRLLKPLARGEALAPSGWVPFASETGFHSGLDDPPPDVGISPSEPHRRGWELDDLVALRDVPRLLPGRPHVGTVFRWVVRGAFGVRLQVVSMGRRRFTTRRWLMAFAEKVETARRQEEPAKTPTAAPRPKIRTRREDPRRIVEARSRAVLRRYGLDEHLHE
jgi:hypothetical protein